jgi:hypothetical protein
LSQQFCANASLNARDLRFNQRAQPVAMFFVERISAAFIQNVLHRLVMQLGGCSSIEIRFIPLRNSVYEAASVELKV